MRNFLLGILFTCACAWIASAGYYAYGCIDAEGSRWSWMPMSMGLTEYKQQLDSVTSCTFDQVDSLLGREAVHYYFNFPGLVILTTMLVLLIRMPSRVTSRKAKVDKSDQYKTWRGVSTTRGESAEDVRQKAKRRL